MKLLFTVVGAFVLSYVASSSMQLRPRPVVTSTPVPGIEKSDDHQFYGAIFQNAASELIRRGKCSVADFREMGGFVRSVNYKAERRYFTLCGGMTVNHRVYVQVEGDGYIIR